MGVNTTGLLNAQAEVYASYKNDAVNKNETSAKKDTTAKTEEKNESGVVYDKSDSSKDNKKATYSINKMSAEDRAALVQQMKADTQSRQQQLISIVQKMMTGQAATASVANGTNSDDIWKFLAKGDFTVDAATKAQAQKDISEDGYYGIKQTSERLFDFASIFREDQVFFKWYGRNYAKDEEDADCHAEGIQTGNRCMGQRPSGHLPEDIGCCKSEV